MQDSGYCNIFGIRSLTHRLEHYGTHIYHASSIINKVSFSRFSSPFIVYFPITHTARYFSPSSSNAPAAPSQIYYKIYVKSGNKQSRVANGPSYGFAPQPTQWYLQCFSPCHRIKGVVQRQHAHSPIPGNFRPLLVGFSRT
jgi:hypothetical protein